MGIFAFVKRRIREWDYIFLWFTYEWFVNQRLLQEEFFTSVEVLAYARVTKKYRGPSGSLNSQISSDGRVTRLSKQ